MEVENECNKREKKTRSGEMKRKRRTRVEKGCEEKRRKRRREEKRGIE